MRKRASDLRTLTLRRQSTRPGLLSLALRGLAVVGFIGFIILVHWIERDGLKDNYDGHVSFLDAVYFTMISATTTGYGDIVPVATNTRLFDALVVTPIRIFLLLIFIGSAYLFVARNTWEKLLMRRIQRGLRGHTIVAGFGTKGCRSVEELIRRGTSADDIVVIDKDPDALRGAEDLGCVVLEADATRDASLDAVHVERARLLLIASGRDDTSILICLTARHLAPDLRISIIIEAADNEIPARQAGADIVINPLNFAGLLLASSHHSQHIADYVADLTSTEGDVHLVEREVSEEEIGRSLKEISGGLGLRILREGRHYGFWRPEAASLRAGDLLIEIRPTN